MAQVNNAYLCWEVLDAERTLSPHVSEMKTIYLSQS